MSDITEPDNENLNVSSLRRRVLESSLSSNSTVTSDQLCTVLRSFVDADKAMAETQKLRNEAEKFREEAANIARVAKADSRRFQLTVLAPLITALAVAMGLGIQVWQVNRNAQQQREANESAQFREAISLVSSKDPLQSIAGAVLVKRLTRSETYKAEARQIEIGVLSRSSLVDSFNLFFPEIEKATGCDNYGELVQVSRNLRQAYRAEGEIIEHEELQNKNRPEGKAFDAVLAEHRRLHDQLSDELDLVSAALATRLKTCSANSLDLRGVYFWNEDFSKLNFREAQLDSAEFANSSVDAADFSQVKSFKGSYWALTPWWHANRLNADLLRYLVADYPFEEGTNYHGQASSVHDFCASIKRLGYSETVAMCRKLGL